MNAKYFKDFFKVNIEWAIHILIWIFLIGERWVNHAPTHNQMLHGTYQTVLLIFTFILPMYLNALLYIPRFLKDSERVKYLVVLVSTILFANIIRGLLTVSYFYFQQLEFNFQEEFLKWTFRDYVSLDRFIFSPTSWILWLSFAYRFVKDWFLNNQERAILESEKSKMELALLRSQVNPHFLFNSLNSLYALALVEKAQLTAEGVSKMGNLMRYTLHDSQVEFISLNKEIDYIENYVALQKLRIIGERQEGVQIFIDVEDNNSHKIAPMLLMPFIENAFKHGITLVDNLSINIQISLDGNKLEMMVQNTIHKVKGIEESGLGLKNVTTRLNLLYPNDHSLQYGLNGDNFLVKLRINLGK
ncbi:MAG: histidine kinase [Bacteroidota bacterium]|nr:histidine kinase [Bacteroidota bacterium]